MRAGPADPSVIAKKSGLAGGADDGTGTRQEHAARQSTTTTGWSANGGWPGSAGWESQALARAAADYFDSRQAATLVRRSCLPPLALRIVW